MKEMLSHSFILDCLDSTAADTFSHFEILIEEHRKSEAALESANQQHHQQQHVDPPSRLKQLVPTIGCFHTNLPLREAFLFYNQKHRLTNRKHIQISFNEIRHILNMAQIMALRSSPSDGTSDSNNNNNNNKMMRSTNENGDDDDDDDDDDVPFSPAPTILLAPTFECC